MLLLSTSVMPLVFQALANFLLIYNFLLIARILLGWFPTVNWVSPPFSIVAQLTDPYLNLFRRFIPPLGGIDFSPILAFFVLQMLQRLLMTAQFSLLV
jgi:YggT family protein